MLGRLAGRGVGVMIKNENEPHAKLKCGAKTRKGTPCKTPAMANGRCRMHGGKSTGPRTPEGLARSKKANWKHGFYSREAIEERKLISNMLKKSRALIEAV